MEYRSYNLELAIANLMFKNIFNNIVIERGGQQIPVSCVLGNKSRVIKALENPIKESTYTLPMIVVTRTGIAKNNDRLANLHNEIKHETAGFLYRNYNLYTPIPVDITYNVTMISKVPGDIDRIISNFILFFNKDVFVSHKHPKFPKLKFSSQVVMDDSINEEHAEELDANADDIISTTCTFTYKTFLFAGKEKSQTAGSPHIKQRSGKYISSWVDPETSAVMSAEISGMVDTIYDGFLPTASTINVGFYAVPHVYSFSNYFGMVENGGIGDPDYDKIIWKIRDDEIVWNPDEDGNPQTFSDITTES